MSLPSFLYLSAADIVRALPMADAVEAVRSAFLDLFLGAAAMPPRTSISSSSGDEVSLIMPCRSSANARLSVKLITLYDRNPALGLPRAHALVILADASNGIPLAVLEGGALTALRTGAVSGVATELLARRDADTVAILGAGRQGRAQLEAVACVRTLREARVFDLDPAAAASFVRDLSPRLGLDIRAASDAGSAIRGAGIICAATSSREPVFADEDVAPGTHINAVGVYQPERAEIPPETVARARVVVDQVESALKEAGDLVRPLSAGLIRRDHIATELGSALAGKAKGRRDPGEVTLFKSVGLAVQDLYAADRAAANARRLGLGTPLPR